MPAAARTEPKTDAASRLKLCTELLDLRIKHGAVFAREEAIKDRLKAIAIELGESFKEIVPTKGSVSVSPAKPSRNNGEKAEVDQNCWQGLKDTARDKLLAAGIVIMVPQITGASYGSVRINVH